MLSLFATAAVVDAIATQAQAGYLYGTFLGTWNGNPDSKCGGSVSPGDCLEQLLSGQYPLTPPYSTLGTGDNQLNPVGSVQASALSSGTPTSTNGRLEITTTTFKDAESVGGTWKYLEDLSVSPPPPGNDPVDFYLMVKYASFFSIFYYDDVDPTDPNKNNGLWSTNAGVLGLTTCADGFADGSMCIAMNTNPATPKPYGLSHIEAYWPPSTSGGNGDCSTDPNGCVIPEPTTMALFGAGLLGIGIARRRRWLA